MATVLERVTAAKPKKIVAGTTNWLSEHVQRGRKEPHAEVVTLTPPLAKIILDNNPQNRNVRPVKVRHFARDMAMGNWPLNGETIILSRDGELNDGQHRLLAVIDANVSIPATIFFGADRETRFTVDQGSARGAGAFLSMAGVPYSTAAGAAARAIVGYQEGDGRHLYLGNHATATDLRLRVDRDPGIVEALEATSCLVRDAALLKVPHSILGFIRYILAHEYDDAAADAFLASVARGEQLRANDPEHVLRAKLIGNRFTKDEKVELILRTWNFSRRGMKIRANSLAVNGNLPALV